MCISTGLCRVKQLSFFFRAAEMFYLFSSAPGKWILDFTFSGMHISIFFFILPVFRWDGVGNLKRWKDNSCSIKESCRTKKKSRLVSGHAVREVTECRFLCPIFILFFIYGTVSVVYIDYRWCPRVLTWKTGKDSVATALLVSSTPDIKFFNM